MNNLTVGLSVLALFALLSANEAAAQEANFMPYGSIGQEDEIAVFYDGFYWVNTGTYLGIGNGQFMKISDLDKDYSIDQAIERFNIYEDTQTFNVKPSLYSDAIFLFELNEDLQFNLVDIYEDSESGLNDEVQQLENNQ